MAYFVKSGMWKSLDLIRFVNTNYNPFIKFKCQPPVVPQQSTQDKIENESSELWIYLLSFVFLFLVLHVITVYLSHKWRHKKTKVESLLPNISSLQFTPVHQNPSIPEKPDVLVSKLQRIKSLISTTLLDSKTNSELGEDALFDEFNLKELAELFMEALDLIVHQNNETSCEKVGELGTDVLLQEKLEEDNKLAESCEGSPNNQLQYELPPKPSSSNDSVKDHESVNEVPKAEDLVNSFKEDPDSISERPKAEDTNNYFEEDHNSVSKEPKTEDINNSLEKDHDSISKGPTAEDLSNSFDEDDESVSGGLKAENVANSFKEDHDSVSKESNAEDINLKDHIPAQDINRSTSDMNEDTPIQNQLDANAKRNNGRTLIIQIDFNKRVKLAEIK